MCGIAGIIDLKGAREIDRGALERMTDALAHRGPDGEGFFTAPGVGLGSRRLAVIDREGGVQPFLAQTREAALVYNGEIYNHKDLARDLSASGQALRTRCDTEVLAEGLAAGGAGFIDRLRGMFAFAFWDAEAKQLTLARDRLGERPLYYAETAEGWLVFASELGALMASGLVAAEIDPQAVADYFFYGYVPDPKTIYRGVAKLPPAHRLTVAPGKAPRLERYWRPVFASESGLSFNNAAETLSGIIDDAVKSQMEADVPLGAFLSGGVDSAGVVAAMREAGGRLVTCTVGFGEASHDERAAARAIAEKFGAEHYDEIADVRIADLIDAVAAAFGEPFADTSALPSFVTAKLARAHVTVALTGDGGDEVFAGYRRYPFFLGEERIRAMAPHALRRLVFGPAGALYPKLDWAPQPLRAKTTLQALAASRADAYAAAVAINLPADARALLHPDLRRTLAGYRPQSVIKAAMAEADSGDPLSVAQYVDLTTWLPGRMLVKVDRASMAHSLEARPPLLDHRLVEWAGRLPPAFKLGHGARKRVLKHALAPRLGRDYVNRPKQGFDLPIAGWLRRDKDNPLERLQESDRWRESGLINADAVETMMRAHLSGRRNCAQPLWSVLMFDAFLRQSQR